MGEEESLQILGMQRYLLLLLAAFHAASMATAATPFNHSIYQMAALKEHLLTGYDIQVSTTYYSFYIPSFSYPH